jgi:hypothetical protein
MARYLPHFEGGQSVAGGELEAGFASHCLEYYRSSWKRQWGWFLSLMSRSPRLLLPPAMQSGASLAATKPRPTVKAQQFQLLALGC